MQARGRFRLCKHKFLRLLDQRCLAIMRQTKLGPVEYHKGWHYSIRLENKPGIKEVALYSGTKPGAGWEIVLALYPGDTMSQARALYESTQEDKIAPLRDGGWRVGPHFHLMYRSSNLYWAETRLSTEEYIGYWRDRVRRGELQQLPRTDWDRWFATWQADGIISPGDMEEIRQSIVVRRFPTLNVCPGLSFVYTWDSERAEAKDDEGDMAFARELRARIADVTATW